MHIAANTANKRFSNYEPGLGPLQRYAALIIFSRPPNF